MFLGKTVITILLSLSLISVAPGAGTIQVVWEPSPRRNTIYGTGTAFLTQGTVHGSIIIPVLQPSGKRLDTCYDIHSIEANDVLHTETGLPDCNYVGETTYKLSRRSCGEIFEPREPKEKFPKD